MENLPIATIRPTSQLHKLVWAGWFLFTSMGSTGCTGVSVPPKEPPLPTVPPLINQTLPPTQPPTVTTPSVIEREPSDHLPSPQRKTNHPVATSCKNIQEEGNSKVAAQLAEMGYFQASIAQPEMTEVTEALKRFQRDLKVSQTGCLDSFTLQKLNSVKLTGVRKAELETVQHPNLSSTIGGGTELLKQPPQGKKNHPGAISCKSIQEEEIHQVAAQLAEMGYFHSSIAQPEMTEVTEALKRFQRDLKVNKPTGCLDSFTLEKLNSVKLTGVRKAELEAVQHPTPVETLPKSVLWIEKIECKSEHEVWVLYYEGMLSIQSSNVTLNKRYALWYDSRQRGESTEDWWCIPRKEFCYTPVKFSDWAGRYRVGQEIRVDDREKMVRDFAKLKELIRDKECRG